MDQEKIDFNLNYLNDDMEFEIDKTAITAALSSILENAVDACLERKDKSVPPQIDLELNHEGNYLVIQIQDNGKGLDPGQQEKIFNLFYSEKGNKGTGLGLFIAQRSVRQHNGTIQVESEPGRFTRFTIRLPVT